MKLKKRYTLECVERKESESFPDAIYREYGVNVPTPIPDGKIHRFDIDKRGDLVGWYVYFEDTDFSCAVYGDWKLGDTNKWQSSNNLTEEQHYRLEAHMAEVEAESKHTQELVAQTARTLYSNADSAKEDHPYLVKKQVGTDTYLVQIGEKLVLPIMDEQFNIVSLQYIYPDGKKQFLKGGQTSGGFCPVGLKNDYTGPVYMAEGYATAKSIQEATGVPCIVAFNAGNLPKVAEELKELWSITIVADNDESGTGEKYAKAAGVPYKLIPKVGMDANDYVVSGYDLKEFLQPSNEHKEQWLVSGNDFIKNYQPTQWLIKGWIAKKSNVMVYGTPGCGKSFTLISQLLSISTGQLDWFGYKVRKGNVVYLAGEGHSGIQKRLMIWSQMNNVTDLGNIHIAQYALDLDTYEGLKETVSYIQDNIPYKPDVIAIDTLNRFFSGDENSAQDARGFMESCSELQRIFECAIIIVHHTGVSEAAQERARGSSAFKGAMDTEILVQNDNGFVTLKQTKQKDGDILPTLELRLKGHRIEGWFDEDGDPVSSATLELPGEEERKAKISEEIDLICDAYRYTDREHDGKDYPYISRTSLKNFLMDAKGMTAAKAKNAMRNEPYRLIGKLVSNNILTASDTGWSITDLETAKTLVEEEIQ